VPSTPIAGKVVVSIVAAIVQERPPAWHLEYEVRNQGRTAIWLVVDESLVFRQVGRHIELSYARTKMQPGAQAFGYFDPEVLAIPPGASVRRSVEISWPSRLSDLWNDKREAKPPPGEYEVSVRVGVASTAAPPSPKVGEGVEAAVLRWQEEAVSPPVRIKIPPYPNP
jgi:hypothetical protein